MAPTLRAALYDRVSTPGQHSGKVRAQLRERAEQLRADVVIDIEEVASGASLLPEREKILQLARAGAVDVVICFNLDRWGRDSFDVQKTVRELQQLEVRWIAIADGFDFRPGVDTDDRRRDFFEVSAAFSGMERRRLRERTRIGMAAARARGARIGRPRVAVAPSDVRTLRKEGLSWREVAMTLGISVGTAHTMANDDVSDAQVRQLDRQLAAPFNMFKKG